MSGTGPDAFAKALADPAAAPPPGVRGPGARGAGRRFDVYRNNVVAGRVEALAATFPATARLCGEDFFDAAARAFCERHPPTSPLLFRYGDGLPAFLAELPGLAPYPYVPDVARVEWARLQALHAADDAAPLDPATLGAIPPEAIADTRLVPHPALAIVPSRWPVATILARASADATDRGPLPEGAEWAVVTRPHLEVATRAVPPPVGRLFEALSHGTPLGEAAEAAATLGDLDLAAAVGLLLEAGAFTAAIPPAG